MQRQDEEGCRYQGDKAVTKLCQAAGCSSSLTCPLPTCVLEVPRCELSKLLCNSNATSKNFLILKKRNSTSTTSAKIKSISHRSLKPMFDWPFSVTWGCVLPEVCTSWLRLCSSDLDVAFRFHRANSPAIRMWPPTPRHGHGLVESLFLEALPSVLRASCHSFSSYCCSHTPHSTRCSFHPLYFSLQRK